MVGIIDSYPRERKTWTREFFANRVLMHDSEVSMVVIVSHVNVDLQRVISFDYYCNFLGRTSWRV